jgi:hypothetical protein
MSNDTQKTEAKVAAIGEVLLVADALLTLGNRLANWLEEKREVGEMTPEEEAAHDAWKEKKFAEWQRSP